MLAHEARRDTRVDADGVAVLLDEQDRTRWDRTAIAEAQALIAEVARRGGSDGPYALQASIAALHAGAARAGDTDWPAILALYDRLARIHPSPVIALNRAAALAMVQGPAAGLAAIDAAAADGALDGHHVVHAARADLLRRLGRAGEAEQSYLRALSLVGNGSERRLLERRLAEVRSVS